MSFRNPQMRRCDRRIGEGPSYRSVELMARAVTGSGKNSPANKTEPPAVSFFTNLNWNLQRPEPKAGNREILRQSTQAQEMGEVARPPSRKIR